MSTLVASQFVTTDQAAEILGVTRRTIQRYGASGKLPKWEVGPHVRYLRSDVESLIRRRT